MDGYLGKILRINLTEQSTITEDLPDDLCRRFLGGRGFGAKLLFDRLPRGIDPLSAENILIFATGPLTGTTAPGSKMSLITQSPLTGGYGDSHVGGHLGPMIRYTGHDVVCLEGASEKPVYLFVHDDGVAFRDAAHIWGKGCFETERALLEAHPGEIQVVSIGPAGENRVRFACLTHDFGRQAGRCGMGAVMGAKNVKAIVFQGTKTIKMADPEAFLAKSRELVQHILAHPAAQQWTELGTALHVRHGNEVGCLPSHNHRYGVSEHADQLSAETMRRNLVARDKGCFGCSMLCGKYSVVRSGTYAGTRIDGPEYEIIALLGSNCGMDNLEVVCRANYLADDLGLDAISAGNVVAFAMECFERGILGPEDTEGLDLCFGNEAAYLAMIEKIARREGLGDLLAEGVRRASQKIGKGSESFAMHSKGLEQSGYETRGALPQVLGYSVNDRGADHNRIWNALWFEGDARYKIEGAAEAVKLTQCKRSAPDIMGTCRFISYYIDFDEYGKLLTAATGTEWDGETILRAAERVYNLTRILNYQLGYTKENDYVPPRIFEEVERGPVKGKKITRDQYETVRANFYRISGWDGDGIPTDEQLAAMDLADLIEDAKRLRST
jgi:aldehyde:ferredoxin oxidoreductase